MSYELLLDDRALTDRPLSVSSAYAVNSVRLCCSRTQAYLSYLILDQYIGNIWQTVFIISIYCNLGCINDIVSGPYGDKHSAHPV